MTEKKKLVFVTYPTGREGTSALMGLIDALGVSPVRNFKDARNPKGFFEDPDYFKMLHAQFPVLFGGLEHLPPSLDQVQRDVDVHIDEFRAYLAHVFRKREALAIKSPKYLCLFQYKHLLEDYDVRIVSTGRNEDAVVKSLIKMWSKRADAARNTESDIRQFVQRWQDFQSRALQHFKSYPVFETSFESLVKDPIQLATALSEFISVDVVDRDRVVASVDSGLVSRANYKSNPFQYIGFKIHNLKEKIRTRG